MGLLQRFCDKLLESKIELDVRIDSIWTKLTSSQEMSELQPLSPGQISWLFSVHCSTQLTFRRQQHEPPPRSLRRQIQVFMVGTYRILSLSRLRTR
jgi:hypothetical protein